MGNEASQSSTTDAKGRQGSLAQEILKLKAAKDSGWLNEEEFQAELKRVLRDWNGDAREPAYDYFEVVRDGLSDSAQMAEWEARYGTAQQLDSADIHTESRRSATQDMVELDLTGGDPSRPPPLTNEISVPDQQFSEINLQLPSPKAKLAPPSDDFLLGTDGADDNSQQ